MKRALVILALLTLGLLACSQTGTGWYPERRKVNFGDSTSFAKSVNFLVPYRIGGTAVTSSAAELNILDGALVNYVELNRLVGVTSSVQTQLNAKQETLVSGTNIRTVNGTSLLGSGNIVIEGGEGGSMVYPGAGIPISTGTAWGTSITNNSVQWDTAFVARNRWDGGAIGLTAATGRTSLGGTTVGQNLFTLTNPDAIRFLRINADNTVTALTAALFKTALSLTSSDVGLGNVTNESKTTMFTSPTFTGTTTVSGAFVPAASLGTGASLGTTTQRFYSLQLQDNGGISFGDESDILLSQHAVDTTSLAISRGNLIFTTAGTGIGTSLSYTPRGYFTDLTVTNTIAGTASLVTGFTRNSGTLTLSGGHGITLTTTALTNVTLPTSGTLATTTQLANDTTTLHNYFEARVDSIVRVLSDTTDIETLLQIDLDTDTIPSMDWVREYVADHGGGEGVTDSVSLAAVAPLLTDTKPWFIFGAGMGEANDSIAFAKGKRSFGSFNVVQDSLYVVSLDNILISANDSLRFNVYYGNRMTGVAVDSLFTGPQACGDNQTTFTPNNETTIPPGNDVWVGLMADQPTGYRPKEWNLQLNAQIRRD